MHIGFIGSLRGREKYGKFYQNIIEHLEKKGHQVDHMMNLTEQDGLKLPSVKREEVFHTFFQRLEQHDVIIAECSFPSINVGYGISYLVQKGKPILILYQEGTEGYGFGIADIISHINHAYVYEYEPENLTAILEEGIHTIELQVDKRFTIIFSAETMNKLERISLKKRLPKAVFIRQAVESQLSQESL